MVSIVADSRERYLDEGYREGATAEHRAMVSQMADHILEKSKKEEVPLSILLDTLYESLRREVEAEIERRGAIRGNYYSSPP